MWMAVLVVVVVGSLYNSLKLDGVHHHHHQEAVLPMLSAVTFNKYHQRIVGTVVEAVAVLSVGTLANHLVNLFVVVIKE
jgi:hypothetical protein